MQLQYSHNYYMAWGNHMKNKFILRKDKTSPGGNAICKFSLKKC